MSDGPTQEGAHAAPHRLAMAPRVAPVYLRALMLEADRVGLDTEPLFRGLGIAVGDLDRPGFMVSHHEATTVVRRALRALDNPGLGLELGMRSRITHRGALALGMLASPTLELSTDLLLRFPHSAGFLLDVRADTSAKLQALVAESIFDSHDLADFLVDKLFAGLVRQRRQICDADCSPVLVELVRAPPASTMSHEQHYRSPVRFNSRSNRLVYDAKWLKWPLPLASAMAYRLSVSLLEREAGRLVGASGFGLAVERAIRLALPQLATPAHVASMLNLSERSLRRKLAQEDLNFRALLDETRRARALDLVTNGRRSMAQAAADTGFGDGRSFRRAFRRWTGSAPSDLRSAHAKGDPGCDDDGV